MFEHEAFFYDDADSFLAGASGFIRDGLARDEPVLVIVAQPKIDALRDVLEGDADTVVFADMTVVGENPARIIPAWQEFIDRYGTGPARGIGEPIHAGLNDDHLIEAQLHEQLINRAFADAGEMYLMCPYDTSLAAPVLEEARRSHPFRCDHTGRRPDVHDVYARGEAWALHPAPLPEPAHVDLAIDYDDCTLAEVRDAVRSMARSIGVPPERIDVLVLAASEIATNSVKHGGGVGHLRGWVDHARLVCEFRDSGSIDDPMVGRLRPPADGVDGRGIWIANQYCDLVQVRSRAGCTTVRLHVHL